MTLEPTRETPTIPTDPQPPPPSGPSTAALFGTLATVIAVAVGGTQLVLNGMQIREKVVVPVNVAPVEQLDAAPATAGGGLGIGAMRDQPDSALPADSEGDAPVTSLQVIQEKVGLLGRDGDDLVPDVDTPMPGIVQWRHYPLPAGQALPAPLEAPVHRLFVALERGIKNAADFSYLIYITDTDALRRLKKPVKPGLVLPLGPATRNAAAPPSVLLTQELWQAIQEAEGQEVIFVACVCTTDPCTAPIIQWEMVRKALGATSITATSIGWANVAKGATVPMTDPDGAPCTIAGPLILALIAPEGA